MARLQTCLLLLLLVPATAQDPPTPPGLFTVNLLDRPVAWSDGYLTRMDIYHPTTPPGANGWPCVLALHGGGGHRRIPRIVALASFLCQRGYVVFTYDIRGEGQTPAWNPAWPTPRTEAELLRDMAESFAVAQGHVPGLIDPTRLAVTGTSMGGNHALKAAAWSGRQLPLAGSVTHHPVIRAAAPEIAAVDPIGTNIPDGLLIGDELVEGRPATDPIVQLLDVEDYAGILAWAQAQLNHQTLGLLQSASVPLFVMLAWQDWKLQPTRSTLALAGLPMPRRLFLTTGGHSTPDNTHEEWVQNELRRRWFDHHVKGIPNTSPTDPYAELAVEPDPPVFGSLASIWEHRTADQWPPNTPMVPHWLRGSHVFSPAPPGGNESGPVLQHRIAPGFTPAGYVGQGAGRLPALLFPQMPKRTLSWLSPPVLTDMELFGQAEAELAIDDSTGVVQLTAVLEIVDPAGTAYPVTIGTGGVRDGVAGRRTLRFLLADIAHVVPAGYRIQVTIQNVADHICPSNRRVQYVPYFTPTDTQILMEPGAASRLLLPLRPYAANLAPRRGDASATAGIDHGLRVRGGVARAGHLYLLALGGSGESPGFPIAGGPTVPLVVDGWTNLFLGAVGPPFCPGFLGVLDASGAATAALRLPPALAALTVGTQFTFAGVTLSPAGFDAPLGPCMLFVGQ